MGKQRGSWSYGLVRERLKNGSHALVLAEIFFHDRKPFGCALPMWRELGQKGVMEMVASDLVKQRRSNYFFRATDDGLKLGSRGRYSKGRRGR